MPFSCKNGSIQSTSIQLVSDINTYKVQKTHYCVYEPTNGHTSLRKHDFLLPGQVVTTKRHNKPFQFIHIMHPSNSCTLNKYSKQKLALLWYTCRQPLMFSLHMIKCLPGKSYPRTTSSLSNHITKQPWTRDIVYLTLSGTQMQRKQAAGLSFIIYHILLLYVGQTWQV